MPISFDIEPLPRNLLRGRLYRQAPCDAETAPVIALPGPPEPHPFLLCPCDASGTRPTGSPPRGMPRSAAPADGSRMPGLDADSPDEPLAPAVATGRREPALRHP